ncbi:hypothetical protein [Rhodococcus opacus]|uniref:Lipoprotein n=1 Tax=Rhodococcus opacus (strain B4) TaxID=632772 RepID=C1ASE6_RHOOB|nr:hypothetical protein [Rhodococcus opacus]BAH48395.1 hypothetical protein ROP_01480 [Rhodococcus opacus B4]
MKKTTLAMAALAISALLSGCRWRHAVQQHIDHHHGIGGPAGRRIERTAHDHHGPAPTTATAALPVTRSAAVAPPITPVTPTTTVAVAPPPAPAVIPANPRRRSTPSRISESVHSR